MAKKVTLEFSFDDDEFEEFMEGEYVQGDLSSWVFAEMCQNQGFGFLTACRVENEDGD